jgi:hypothetical protein
MTERITAREFRGLAAGKAKRPNKFGAKRAKVDGITFHSQREAARYGRLKLLERAGVISGLRLQVPYDLEVNGHHVTRYVADFEYTEAGALVTEDAKGHRTPEYKIKAALFFAITGRQILET